MHPYNQRDAALCVQTLKISKQLEVPNSSCRILYFGICETLAFVRPLWVGEAQNGATHKLVVVVVVGGVVVMRRAYLEFLFTFRPGGCRQTLSSPSERAHGRSCWIFKWIYAECVFSRIKNARPAAVCRRCWGTERPTRMAQSARDTHFAEFHQRCVRGILLSSCFFWKYWQVICKICISLFIFLMVFSAQQHFLYNNHTNKKCELLSKVLQF